MKNRGYVGYSRSIRSEMAIKNYEVPKSLIKKDLINNFLNYAKTYEIYTEKELIILKKFKICHWKFIADKYISPASWHHTSSYFNKTNHYSLSDIADNLLKLKGSINELYEESKDKKEAEKKNYSFGVIKVQIWSGSRQYPKLLGEEVQVGIVVGKWLYYTYQKRMSKIYKLNIEANKVISFNEFNSIKELEKEYSNLIYNKEYYDYIIGKILH